MRPFLASIAIAAVLPLAAVAEPAQTPGSNITISLCRAQLDKPPLKIAYTNTSPLTATEVDFTLTGSAGTITRVKDTGQFTTGTPISHVFSLPDDTSPLGLSSARCVVTKVVYADGTTWVNPSPP
jgi:hypothetical protein